MNFKQSLQFLLNAPIEQSILITGAHGIGKSDLVRQAASMMGEKGQGGDCIDIRLSQNDVGDLKGMPFLVNGRTFFAPPNWYPVDEKSKTLLSTMLKQVGQEFKHADVKPNGILFLDELNRATRECEQVAFQLVLDRCLNFIDLPPGWRVVAAINDDTDLYNTSEMDPALLSRFAVVPFHPTIDEWLEYAKDTGIHTAVYQYITKIGSALDVTPDMMKNPANRGKKMWDRRSWTKLSKNIQEFEKKNPKWLTEDSELRRLIFEAYIGTEMGAKFNQFVEKEYVVLSASKILNDWDKEVEKHLSKAKVVELSGYNKLLVDYMKSDKEITAAQKLSKKQAENLFSYVAFTHKEVGADFWTHFNHELGKISDQWYNNTIGYNPQTKTRQKASDLILTRLASPDAVKRQGIEDKEE